MTSRSRSQTYNFYVKVLVHLRYDDGPKFYTVPSPSPYMTFRSRSLTKNFYVKVFRTSLFPNPVGTTIDTGPKLYAVPSTHPIHDFKVKVTLNFFKTLLFLNPVIYLFHAWHDD